MIHGNEHVIKALEKLLETARSGARHGYLVAVMVSEDQPSVGGWFGSVSMEEKAADILGQMAKGLDDEIRNKKPPARAAFVPADRVCCNVSIAPMSFDFASWLIEAEMRRRIEQAPAPLKVGFWFGRDGKTGLPDDHRKKMFAGVVKPLLDLIGAVEDETAVDGRISPMFASRNIVELARAGFEVPRFFARDDLLQAMMARYGGAVTITLREASYDSDRNSDMAAWLEFAQWLKRRGERVVFVRDTAMAHEPIEGFEICPEASVDLQTRMALYECAGMNMFVSNGPSALGFFGNFPWMVFMKTEDDDHPYKPNTPKFWRESIGVEMGSGQFPWSRPDQRFIWKPETCANLIEAWEQVMPENPARRTA